MGIGAGAWGLENHAGDRAAGMLRLDLATVSRMEEGDVMERRGKSSVGYQELPTAEGCGEPPRVQAGGGGGSRWPPLPAHGPALRSPPTGMPRHGGAGGGGAGCKPASGG